ncbi:MAG: hypothetical protein NTW74_16425, partial [Acidobacteria bacterium]|nr:hypothetical protein [Acidobacteriota bacterium]
FRLIGLHLSIYRIVSTYKGRMRFFFLFLAMSAFGGDQDLDGVQDELEQRLIERFVPKFYVAVDDCDVAPAEFERGRVEPVAKSRNGTIYGQVFAASGGLEVHYYHLWAADCGRGQHPLDAEHVSAFLTEEKGEWRARYWYAAAHEDTVCDRGSAAKAAMLYSEWRGPEVWISRGKHASFLSEAACKTGCGADRCDRSVRLKVSQLVNLGEVGNRLNGSEWALASGWNLREKMGSDFPAELRKELDASKRIISANPGKPGVQPVIAAGSTTIDALALANTKTEGALSKAHKSVKSWLKKHLP